MEVWSRAGCWAGCCGKVGRYVIVEVKGGVEGVRVRGGEGEGGAP